MISRHLKALTLRAQTRLSTLFYWIAFAIFLIFLLLSMWKYNANIFSKIILTLLLAGLTAYFNPARKSNQTFTFSLVAIAGLVLAGIIGNGLLQFWTIVPLFFGMYYLFRFLFKKGFFSWGE